MSGNKKINFFKQFGMVFTRPDKYGELIELGTGRMIGFTFFYSFVYWIVMVLVVAIVLLSPHGIIKKFIDEELPEFYIEDGNLHMNESYNLKGADSFLFADASVEQFGLDDLQFVMDKGEYNTIFLISKTNLVCRNNQEKILEFKFSELNDRFITKSTLRSYFAKYLKIGLALVPFCMFPFWAISHFAMSLIVMLFAFIFSLLLRKSLSARQLYSIGIYTYAIMSTVSLILKSIPIKVSNSISFPVSCLVGAIYLYFGVISAGNYFIKQHQLAAQSAARVYGGYSGYDAFSNEPIPELETPENINGEEKGFSVAKDTVIINGIICAKPDLDLIDKYILVGLKDAAVAYLCKILNCTDDVAKEILANWKQYYNG